MKQAKSKLPVPTEYQEACTFADWLRLNHIPFTHIVNESGATGSPAYGARLKKMGRSKGFPDYIVYVDEAGDYVYTTLYIEMKRVKKSKVSDEQKEWMYFLDQCVWSSHAKVCHGAEEAIRFVESFFKKKGKNHETN